MALAPLLAMAVSGDLAAQKKPTKVSVDKVRLTEVAQTFPVIGRFVARQSGVVASRVGGPVDAVLVEVGDRVKKGQVIARLVPDRLRANRDLLAVEIREKQSAVRAAEAQLKLTLGELARLDGLRKSAAFSQARYNDKRNEVAKYRGELGAAEGAVARARANLKLASIDLYNAEIRTPYDAVVVRRSTVAGAYLSVGDPVVWLVNDLGMEIEADVPANRLVGLGIGRKIEVRRDDGIRFGASIRAIVPSESAATRTRPVRFVLESDPDPAVLRGLAENQSVTVLLPVAKARRLLTVHKDAVVTRGGAKVVVLVEGGKTKSRSVRVGEAVGDRFAVEFGLKAGDIVVIRGNERLRPGQSVIYDTPSGKPSG